ncbi:DNA-binding PadR family transcriptional regulator [Actinoalloteichus hoggarensis]|uniref:Transcriptional regulator PadR-like family protein n=1 Tax=Actinoalloteichus hoggarensis TaxID=1470176 RepID=A0A221W546_9PSEU|nr:helix-turn-helix transcriptional regulator [Actinoalloteichus hoggarensis]ASO20988.1 Transcriptional regulator PadR-like family protein [Actinoalloteichus hoggarensis]MBB5920919.1 DNA-binding PadR family transcriptional regulator [Actinoalloteichus hoggarensis]
MSATRLLVLGVVRGFGRAHGYLLHTELSSWAAEGWIDVKWGSIYHGLRQLAKLGHLRATEIEAWPGRVDYELTPAGETEFFRLLRDALRRAEHRPDVLAAGLALMPALSRDEVIALLRERLAALEDEIAELPAEPSPRDPRDRQAHLDELSVLSGHTARGDAEWTRRLIARLTDGAYLLRGDGSAAAGVPGSWTLSGEARGDRRR